jgi:hypothetical protein
MTTVVEVEMGCLKYVTLNLCTFMPQKFDINTWFAHEPTVYKVFLKKFGAILWLRNNIGDHPQEKLAKLNCTGQEESRKF